MEQSLEVRGRVGQLGIGESRMQGGGILQPQKKLMTNNTFGSGCSQ